MRLLSFTLFCLIITLDAFGRAPVSRIKDIADVEGVRHNILIGYSLVVGLAGTGDSANAIPFTRQSLINMLEKMGVNAKAAEDSLKTKNVAAVMVTANMPSYARQGSSVDVTVSSLGDAKSLEGGQLLATSMIGADGNTYALAQGPVILGGFTAEGRGGSSITKNHTTSGHIAGGAIVEVETGHELAQQNRIRLLLRNPDFTTARRMEKAINKHMKHSAAAAVDNGTVDIKLAANDASIVSLIHQIENIRVRPDNVAKVVIDEKTGTVVMGDGVQISDVAISHANLTIRVTEMVDVIQPEGFSDGITAAAPFSTVEAHEGDGQFHVLDGGPTLADLIDGLNALGVKPRDIISILQTIKAAGALQADIELL